MIRTLRSIAAVAILALAATPVLAQSNAERILNDRYTRSHDYDLLHQQIQLGGFDWDSLSFEGWVATTLVARRPAFDVVKLDAGPLLEIQAVTTAGAWPVPLVYEHSGDTLAVWLRRPAAFGDTLRFVVAYRGRVENGRGLTFIKADSGRAHRPQQIWSQGETDNHHHWFPTYDAPNDKLTWQMAITVPAAYTAVSNGRLVADVRRGALRTMTWAQDRPASSYLASLVVAPLVRLRDRWRGVPLDYYVYREDSALARPLFSVTPDMIEVYSRLTGVRYPWAKYAQTTVADFFGGMENVSATTLVDWLPDAPAYHDRPWFQHVLIPHELAHQWFGDLVTLENWAHMWLNEGFAEFMPGQYWGEKRGRHAADDYYLDEYTQFMQVDARRRMPLASLGSNNIYPKGALVLAMLEKHLGRDRFWASVHRYLERDAGANAVSDDFRQAILDATGENLDWFFDEWVYQAGYPEFEVSDAYDSTAQRLTLTVKQTQVDTATADSTGLRFTTPQVFRMPVTIRVATSAGEVTRRVPLDRREQTIAIDSVAAAPAFVVFDDGNAILKQLRYEQPTARLAAQLAGDPDLWSRHWVIEQLAARTQDSLAGQALARAATGADYFLTREQAVEALTGVPASIALPALMRAAADTSAPVRTAAFRAMAQLGAPDTTIPLARAAWERDSSYEVRAAALSALARLGAPDRHDLLHDGLRTPSYRDAIRDAAIIGAVQTGDSALVEDIAAHAAEGELPNYALAALASRGGPAAAPALAILHRQLADPRPWVRRLTIEAIQHGMEPALALRELKAAAPTLTDPPTRAAAEHAIGELEHPAATH